MHLTGLSINWLSPTWRALQTCFQRQLQGIVRVIRIKKKSHSELGGSGGWNPRTQEADVREAVSCRLAWAALTPADQAKHIEYHKTMSMLQKALATFVRRYNM